MEERVGTRAQKVNLLNRSIGAISGVQEVKAFNETEIVLETDMGVLSIKGTGLHVTKLTLEKGEVEIDGTVDSLIYTDMKESGTSGGIFGRLFR